MNGIHFLLSYTCNLACDHCFLYCSPRAQGTMTLGQIESILHEAETLGTIEEVYFEGGEPFLFYPVMVEGIRAARKRGFNAGVVTNGYWATSVEDAKLWLTPLAELGVFDLSISDDDFHFGREVDSPSQVALAAAKELGIPTLAICKEKPEVLDTPDLGAGKGAPEISGGIKLRGRAAESFAGELPTRPAKAFTTCPYEELEHPKRVHVDCYGTVQVCQGISIGNCWETPFSELILNYDAQEHAICGPLVRGGPAQLVRERIPGFRGGYVDECHLCYTARSALVKHFPQALAPQQVYNL